MILNNMKNEKIMNKTLTKLRKAFLKITKNKKDS